MPPGFKLTQSENVTKRNLSINPLYNIPDALQTLLTKNTTLEAVQYLQTLVEEVEAATIDAESTYKPFAQNSDKTSVWASGGGNERFLGKLWRFKEAGHTTFFENIFNCIQNDTASRYSRNNLFHGHAVYDIVDTQPDFRIVFHAYEYPTTYEPTKSEAALTIEPGIPQFPATNEAYFRRNAIWSMRDNAVYIPNYWPYLVEMESVANFTYFNLLTNKRETVTIDQDKVGDPLITLNYFPNEQVAVFLKQ